MSSMSVVDSVQSVNVNKNTHPQDILKHKNDVYFPSKKNDIVQLSSYQNDVNVTYPDASNSQIIDFPMDATMIRDFSLMDEDPQKVDQLKGFASFLVPAFAFVKRITPDFVLPSMLQFNFTPLSNFFDSILSSVSDTCALIYDTGEQAFNATVKFIKNTSESVFNTSVDFGKSVISTVTDFYNSLTSSSDDDAEIQSNSIPVADSSTQINEKIESEDVKKPYWYALNKTSDGKDQIFLGNKFQNYFNQLRQTSQLNDNFLFEGDDSVLQVNGQQISNYSPEEMLNDFKYAVPNLESRQLISAYSNKDLFSKPYVELFSERPELADLKVQDVKMSYVVDELNDGTFQLVATSKSKLDSSHKIDGNMHDSFGLQASTILSKDKISDIEYAYFLM